LVCVIDAAQAANDTADSWCLKQCRRQIVVVSTVIAT
jgi:hypothetical protein